MAFSHISAMVPETIGFLDPGPGKIIVDGTLGGCGHALKIAESISPDGLLIGIDQDLAAVSHAQQAFAHYGTSVRIFHDNFENLAAILSRLNISAVDGIVLDLGLSLNQLEASGRGFSFQREEPLDMRMDVRAQVTAEETLNQASASELASIFTRYGEERFAKKIARQIAAERKLRPIRTTGQLVSLVRQAIPAKIASKMRIHPATRVFMALRIHVNQELACLETFLKDVNGYLRPGGRLCILSFHSLEDRIVKQGLREMTRGCTCPPDFPKCVCEKQPIMRLLTRKPVRPGEAEIERNPMARSTRLRAAEKL